MTKLFILFLFLTFSLSARENPFFPSAGEENIPFTEEYENTVTPLKRATISLPSQARTIESVTIKYKNLDGSIDEKTEILGNSVDWHLPIFVSQNYGGVEKKTAKKRVKYVKLAGLKFISLLESKKSLKLFTKDVLIRDFLLIKPHRIVCDFKRDLDIRSYQKNMKQGSKVKMVRFGNHKGYYRVVIELDGYYSYSLKKIDSGYIFKLH